MCQFECASINVGSIIVLPLLNQLAYFDTSSTHITHRPNKYSDWFWYVDHEFFDISGWDNVDI